MVGGFVWVDGDGHDWDVLIGTVSSVTCQPALARRPGEILSSQTCTKIGP